MPFGNGGKPGRFSRRSKRPRWNTKLAVLALLGLAVCLGPAICRLQTTFTAPTAVLNVKDAGAKGDGIADDTEAFRLTLHLAADSRGGAEVIVPAGTYLLRPDQPLPLGSHVSVRGQGSPVLKFTAAPDAGHGFEAIEIAGRDIRLEGLVIDGGYRLNRGIGIHTGSSDVRITGSVIRHFGPSDDPQSPLFNSVVSGLMIYGGTEQITIQGCMITGIAAAHHPPVARGIMVWSEPGKPFARFVNITGNVISHITPREDADGIFFDKPPSESPLSRSVIEGNLIHHAAKRGIKISAPGVTVTRNRITNSFSGDNRYLFPPDDPLPQDMYSAISVYASHVTVSGNSIGGTGSYYAAIEADAGPLHDLVIENNKISGGTAAFRQNTSGIRLGEVRRFRITGNTISQVEKGIRLSPEAKAETVKRKGTGKIADNNIADNSIADSNIAEPPE